MTSKFTQKEEGKYIDVTYNHGLELKCHKLKFNASQYCINETHASDFIKRAENIEAEINKILTDKKSSYNVNLIMLTFMQAIESISSGIDVRSKISDAELALRFYDGYNVKHKEASLFCEKIREMYESGEKNEGYSKHWRDYNQYNELIDEYHLDFKKLGLDDFKISFTSMSAKADDILQMFKDLNKDKE